MALFPRKIIRQEDFQRIQIGIAGLCGVLLLVGLTNVIIDNVRKENVLDTAQAGGAGEAPSNSSALGPLSEPLADLGVTPAQDSRSSAMPVPDLEPDPRLQKPMDRDPRQHQ